LFLTPRFPPSCLSLFSSLRTFFPPPSLFFNNGCPFSKGHQKSHFSIVTLVFPSTPSICCFPLFRFPQPILNVHGFPAPPFPPPKVIEAKRSNQPKFSNFPRRVAPPIRFPFRPLIHLRICRLLLPSISPFIVLFLRPSSFSPPLLEFLE